MATPQEEMTSLEVVKLIEAEADEEGDILEELSNQDIKEIYQQLSQLSGYHADTPITIKAEPSIWPTAAFINIHEHPL